MITRTLLHQLLSRSLGVALHPTVADRLEVDDDQSTADPVTSCSAGRSCDLAFLFYEDIVWDRDLDGVERLLYCFHIVLRHGMGSLRVGEYLTKVAPWPHNLSCSVALKVYFPSGTLSQKKGGELKRISGSFRGYKI